jgi:cold shock CspA family protein
MDGRMTGVVKNINGHKLYGFITGEDKKDYFFHRTDFSGHWDDLVADASNIKVKVEFNGERNPKGLRARNVSRLDWPNQAAREAK